MLAVSAAYSAATGRNETWASSRIFGSGQKLKAMRVKGADAASHRVEDALQWFSDHWPEDASWPDGIRRPPPARPPAEPTTD